ncbi:LamG-like jellyroll fold [Beggiatoa sp. PS]|nr:LamG-like jellyroll fold [Beggiatoa sp. PS]
MKLNFNNFLQVAFIVCMMTIGRVAWADLNDGLVAYYPFNGNANDESGNENDGTVNGATLTVGRLGKADSAYGFDGNSSRIVVSGSSSLNPVDQLSIAFWINIEDTTNRFSFILHKGGSNVVNSFQNREYGAYMDGLRFILASAGNSSGQHYLYSSAAKLGEWIFYTAVIDRQNHFMKIYLNGTLNAEKNDSYSSFNNNNYDLVFGGIGEGHSSYSPFNGKLDDVCIYNRALSENEIQSLYTGEDECNSPPPPPVNVAPASCQLYAVNDKGLNNSQFFTVNLDDHTVSGLGPMYEGHDIEALAIHPETNMIYAASGDNVTNGKKGHFYQVDGETGEISAVGSTTFEEIEDLAFSPDGTLYAWAKGDGLITIDLATGKGTVVLDSDIPLEGLTLKKNEDNVFLGTVGTELWQYDGIPVV